MKFIAQITLSLVLMGTISANATAAVAPTLDLEQKIAYQQGQFGALYAHCASVNEREVIGGTLANWRMETFRGYNGSVSDKMAVEKAFDTAANDVNADTNSCVNWIKQASATWHSIVYLSQYGTPVATN